VQTGIELQGKNGVFPGVPVAELDADHQATAAALVDRILATYPAEDVAYARACLDANGGVGGLSVSYYQRGDDGEIPEAQVFRLEGPGAVLYFRGYPHVHAFVNIAMNGEAPLSSGELLNHNPAWLDHAGVKRLFESALRTQTGADFGYYPEASVAGRLRPGPIRSGDIYTLESWLEEVAVGEIHGSIIEGTPFATLVNPAGEIVRSKRYTVATTGWGANDLKDRLGRVEDTRPRGLLRDLAVAYVKVHGFAS